MPRLSAENGANMVASKIRSSQAVSESCARASFRVVVDVGHTADVPGAMSARGIPEYAFNLQLARKIKQALVDAGFEQTVLLITATPPWRS
jgi:N-acetylmuramoyl-L-alanine amidase